MTRSELFGEKNFAAGGCTLLSGNNPQLSLDEIHLNVRIMMNFVNRELSVLFQTELVPSPTTYNGDAKVVWLRDIRKIARTDFEKASREDALRFR